MLWLEFGGRAITSIAHIGRNEYMQDMENMENMGSISAESDKACRFCLQ